MMFGSEYAWYFSGSIGLDDTMDIDVKVPVKEKTYLVALGGTLKNLKPDFSKIILGNLADQIPIKDEDTKEAVEKGLEILEGILK